MTKPSLSDSRRSSRVLLRILISVEDNTHRTFEGETEIVNLHGALINTNEELPYGAKISVHVYLTDKYAKAKVVFINALNRLQCGIELEKTWKHLRRPIAPPMIGLIHHFPALDSNN